MKNRHHFIPPIPFRFFFSCLHLAIVGLLLFGWFASTVRWTNWHLNILYMTISGESECSLFGIGIQFSKQQKTLVDFTSHSDPVVGDRMVWFNQRPKLSTIKNGVYLLAPYWQYFLLFFGGMTISFVLEFRRSARFLALIRQIETDRTEPISR